MTLPVTVSCRELLRLTICHLPRRPQPQRWPEMPSIQRRPSSSWCDKKTRAKNLSFQLLKNNKNNREGKKKPSVVERIHKRMLIFGAGLSFYHFGPKNPIRWSVVLRKNWHFINSWSSFLKRTAWFLKLSREKSWPDSSPPGQSTNDLLAEERWVTN